VIRRGVQSGQLEKADELEAAPFVHVADELAKGKQWSAAVEALDQGLSIVDDASKTKLRQWLVQIHRQWSEVHRKEGKFDAAMDVLSQLVKRLGEDADAQNAVAYFAQEALGQIETADGPAAAADLLGRLRKRFDGIDYLDEAGEVCARKAIDKLLRAKKYDEALAELARYQPLLADDQARDELGGLIYDQWGRDLVRQKQFERAVKVYGQGRKQFSGSELLKNNVVVAWDNWAAEAMKRKDWREAIRIYELALEALGDNAHLQHNLEVARGRLK
jgi:tetratricopeptide (TPR) repeat protein